MPKSFDTFRVKASLPGELELLRELAFNLHWSWNHETIDLFRRLDRDLWESTVHNPVRMLGTIKRERLLQAADDDGFMAQLRRSYHDLHDYLSATTWFESTYEEFTAPQIAYFSMEYGLSECLPIYSGGLGILAGDHLKSASELGLPLVGVGLLYQKGYFRQYLNADGWQQETYLDNDFYNLPIQLQLDEKGAPILVDVDFPERKVYCRIWKAQIGRIPLYLMDTNTPENQYRDRKITLQLYGGDQETRIQQEFVLGVGGVRALRRLGINPQVCHMNEGHAAFLALEQIRHLMDTDSLSAEEALEVVRGSTVFTTHTPVPAGIDIFSTELVDRYFAHLIDRYGIARDDFLALGRFNRNDAQEPFNMAVLALRTSAYTNGVSRLHGEVSRKMFQGIWPHVPEAEVPIGHVTNGIHTRSWISADMSALFLRYLGPDWLRKPADQSLWQRVDLIPDVELWRVHERRKDRLVGFTRGRLVEQLKQRGGGGREVEHAHEVLNPEALTIGFARRFATYKRATLLFSDPERLTRLITSSERPVQFIFAGKAHPKDSEGKELIKRVVHFARRNELRKSIVFIEDYGVNTARYLVQGVDVWLNNPRRPQEASGTSGMKVIPNGGLNFSVLDGWWCEGFETDTGWAIGAGEDYVDRALQDEIESKMLYDVLENEIVPLYYELGSDRLPRRWIAKMKRSMKTLGPVFSTNRMVREYAEDMYVPARDKWNSLSADNHSRAKALVQWKRRVVDHWGGVEILSSRIESREAEVGSSLSIEAHVRLGGLMPDEVEVQIYSGPLDGDYNITESATTRMEPAGPPSEGVYDYRGSIPCDDSGLFGYLVRVMPRHRDMSRKFALDMMRWIGQPSEQLIHH